MQGLLQGKRVLITGAGRGIGLAIARLFAAQGAELWLAGRDEAALSRLADELGAELLADLVVHARTPSLDAAPAGATIVPMSQHRAR